MWCPCCGYKVRNKPRNLKYKKILRLRTQKTPLPESDKNVKQMSIDAQGNIILENLNEPAKSKKPRL
jgi:hypothetical protein